jgi:catechol 2,3-dioxygenase-like lactoylglutathione lyase family enzyme
MHMPKHLLKKDERVVQGFERIIISVADVVLAAENYTTLLGQEADWRSSEYGDVACFTLANTAVELVAGDLPQGRITGLVFADSQAGDRLQGIPNDLGLNLARCDGGAGTQRRQSVSGLLVDHLVLRTTSAEACLELFGDRLGLRLALDQTVPEWGGRMLFYRSGGMTLEIIESEQKRPSRDYFWGIAYQCEDIEAASARLTALGVQLSPWREGRKPGTRVATLKSHNLGVPTLLIQPSVT